MKKITVIVLMVLCFYAVNAKEEEKGANKTENTTALVVSGTVADEKSGESLVGVEVNIAGTDMKTYTDLDGNFTFKNVKPGEYKVVTNYISYQKKTEVLNVTANDNKLQIKLQSSN